jgi:hypothetical protein
VRQARRHKHHSYRTERACVHWIKRFIVFQNKRHPKDMGAPEIEAFLTQPSVVGMESGNLSSQSPALLHQLLVGRLSLDESSSS